MIALQNTLSIIEASGCIDGDNCAALLGPDAEEISENKKNGSRGLLTVRK